MKLTRDELLKDLKIQLDDLHDLNKIFDNNFIDGKINANMIANKIRTIIYDGAGQSLLTLLDDKEKIIYYSTAIGTLVDGVCHELITTIVGGTHIITPINDFETGKNNLNFNQWWENEIILKNKDEKAYSRKDLITIAANKLGGSHVDGELKKHQNDLKNGDFSDWEYKVDNQIVDIKQDIIWATIRTISFELLESLKDYYTEIDINNVDELNYGNDKRIHVNASIVMRGSCGIISRTAPE